MGMWTSAMVCAPWFDLKHYFFYVFAVAFIGQVIYEFVEKFVPCSSCAKAPLFNDWEVV
jgi:hypothetical protein